MSMTLDPSRLSQQTLDLFNSMGIDLTKMSSVDDVSKETLELLSSLGADLSSAVTSGKLKDYTLPTLSLPVGTLSLDTLMSAIGDDVRRQAVQSGVQSLEAKADHQAEVNEKQLAELKKQIEEMAKKKVLNGFLKAFQIIGAIVGAIASVATIAAGALTANPLLIGVGIAAAVMTVDSVVSLASDGKYSMMAGFTALAKACGADDKTAQWIAMGIQIALTVVVVAASCGAALGAGAGAAASTAGSVASTAGQATKTALSITQLAQKITNCLNATLQVANGSATIANAVISYKVEDSKASTKELEAILERIRESIKSDQKLVESEMERANKLLSSVKDIVDNCLSTQATVLGASPALA